MTEKKYIHFGRAGRHLVEHPLCYVIPHLLYALGRISYWAKRTELLLELWHYRHAHGATFVVKERA